MNIKVFKNRNFVKYLVKMFIIILLLNMNIYAKDNNYEREAIFKKAASEYSKKNYEEALNTFQQLENTDKVSFELLFDVGNCYYRLDELGEAIQYWEKAKKLNPSNDDVNFNLKLANVKLQDKVILPKPFFLFKYYHSIRQNINIKHWMNYLGIIFLVTIIIFIIPKFFNNKRRLQRKILKIFFIPKYILILSLIIISVVLFDSINYNNNNKFGIVVVNKIKVKTEPKENGETSFILHEGSKIKILSKFNRNWYKISYFDDKIGWIESNKIGEI